MSGEIRQGAEGHHQAPWAVDKTRTKVLDADAKGPTVKAGQSVEMNYAGVQRRAPARSSTTRSARGTTVAFNLAQVVPGFRRAWSGSTQGSRVLIAMPGSDGYDAAGGNPQIGVKVGDTLMFVVDIVAVPLDGPEGTKK